MTEGGSPQSSPIPQCQTEQAELNPDASLSWQAGYDMHPGARNGHRAVFAGSVYQPSVRFPFWPASCIHQSSSDCHGHKRGNRAQWRDKGHRGTAGNCLAASNCCSRLDKPPGIRDADCVVVTAATRQPRGCIPTAAVLHGLKIILYEPR